MSNSLKVVNLKCANCGGALQIHRDMDQFACGYCGSQQLVERRGGTISLRSVVDAVAGVQIGTDKTAAESMFMSYPANNHVEVKVQEISAGSLS